MHRKMQNKMKMIYFRSVNNNKDLYSAKKGGGAPNGILSDGPHVPPPVN